MPCLEISLPKIDLKTKEKLATELTEAFSSITGHDAQIFEILFREQENHQTAVGGKLSTDENPYLHFLLYSPRLSRSKKQSLAESFSKIFSEATQPHWKPVIHISEHPYDNVGVNGKLISDAIPECAEKEFYYDLPKD